MKKKKLYILGILFYIISNTAYSQDRLVNDSLGRYLYFEGNDFVIKRDSSKNIGTLSQFKDNDILIQRAVEIKLPHYPNLSWMPVLINMGCSDISEQKNCIDICVRPAGINCNTKVIQYQTFGAMFLYDEGDKPETLMLTDGKQIIYFPYEISLNFVKKVDEIRSKISQ